tara:strand:- start:346 stop:1320 length:975 start_codon:yes stop_codon:yes gene_type:complete
MSDTDIDPVAALSTEGEILDSIGEGNESTTSTEEVNDSAASESNVEENQSASREVADTSSNEEQGVRQSHGPQDLVDGNGNVLAKGGTERRLWEKAQKFERANNELNRQVQQLSSTVQALQSAGNVGSQYGLTPEELTFGAQLMKSFKENPAGTAQYVLTQAQAMGHNIEGASGADMGAIKQMITDAIAPLTADTNRKNAQAAAERQATEQYNQFIGTYPDAAVHVDVLAQLLQSEPNLTPEAAYFKLKSFYGDRGLDWTKPLDVLKKEIEARQNQPVAESTQANLPNGGVNTAVQSTTDVADVDVSTSDIIRQSMREAGMNIN